MRIEKTQQHEEANEEVLLDAPVVFGFVILTYKQELLINLKSNTTRKSSSPFQRGKTILKPVQGDIQTVLHGTGVGHLVL